MADYFRSGASQPEEFEVGLHKTFETVAGHDIGQFPGLDSDKKVLAVQASSAN